MQCITAYERILDNLNALRPAFLMVAQHNLRPPCSEVTLQLIRPKKAWLLFENEQEKVYVLVKEGVVVRLLVTEGIIRRYQSPENLSRLDIDAAAVIVSSAEIAARHLERLIEAMIQDQDHAKVKEAEAEALLGPA